MLFPLQYSRNHGNINDACAQKPWDNDSRTSRSGSRYQSRSTSVPPTLKVFSAEGDNNSRKVARTWGRHRKMWIFNLGKEDAACFGEEKRRLVRVDLDLDLPSHHNAIPKDIEEDGAPLERLGWEGSEEWNAAHRVLCERRYLQGGMVGQQETWYVDLNVFRSPVLFVDCLTSQQHVSVSRGRILSDKCTCCHTERGVVDQTCYLAQSQCTDTRSTSPSTYLITPAWWERWTEAQRECVWMWVCVMERERERCTNILWSGFLVFTVEMIWPLHNAAMHTKATTPG